MENELSVYYEEKPIEAIVQEYAADLKEQDPKLFANLEPLISAAKFSSRGYLIGLEGDDLYYTGSNEDDSHSFEVLHELGLHFDELEMAVTAAIGLNIKGVMVVNRVSNNDLSIFSKVWSSVDQVQ